MSEYWVSHKRYLCKYCNIYIADDAPSRRQHEGGLKHKGNVERFVRGLYKAGEKRKQDREEERREMERVERAANAAYAEDVAGGRAKGMSSASAGPSSAAAVGPSKKAAAPKPSNPFANYSTAESLGFTDPDAERLAAEAERRRTMGVAGEWEVVDAGLPPADGEPVEEGAAHDPQTGEKRSAPDAAAGGAAVEEEDESGRAWKLRRKTASVGLGELYDPGALPIKLKKKEAKEFGAEDVKPGVAHPLTLGGSEKPVWKPKGWNKPGEYSTDTGAAEIEAEAEEGMKKEEEGEDVKAEAPEAFVPEGPLEPEVKTEVVKPEPTDSIPPPPPAGGSMFKKRRAPAGGNRGGRRT